MTNDPTPVDIGAEIKAAESHAFKAWPAEACVGLGGWVQRRTPGARTRRTNSVCANALSDGYDVDDLIIQVEAFSRLHNLLPRFQISPAVEPSDLDARLEARGYTLEAPTLVQWAKSTDVQNATPEAGDLHNVDTRSTGWNTVHRDASISDEDLSARNAIIDRITAKKALMLVEQDGQAAAIGLGVFEGGWCGIFCMHTLSLYRRRGLADRVLALLVDWTEQQGGTNLYLQVEQDNTIAQSFYAARGFTTAYGYHYRTLFN